jgi:hypothetical protein
MRVAIALLLAGTAAAGDRIEVFGHRWTVQSAADWKIEDGPVLRLIQSANPVPGQPRRPQKFALAETPPFRRVTVDVEMRRGGRSLIIVYAWQDESHYNYAHISSDTALKQPVHNGMFHVFGGERVRISPLDGPASFTGAEWTPVKLAFDGDSGRCYVEVNGRRNPSLEAVDLSLRHGRVGLGSFNELGDFRRVRISGETRNTAVIGHQ